MSAIIYEKAVAEDLDLGTGSVQKTDPGGGTLTGTRINLESFAYGTYSGSWAAGTIDSTSAVTTDITIVGARIGDFVLASFAGILHPHMVFHAYVSADDTVTVAVTSNLGSQWNLGTGTLRVMVFKTNL
jgi:hypothetical protein